ncbi:F-box/FBD/LRR-repeat protein-like protein [Tanacetum coccineum]
MKLVHETCKASKFASEDVFDRLPDNVMTNILDCLPIQEAVRTGILSKNWRLKWTMLTQLVFDEDFLEYLEEKGERKYYGRIISRLLINLKGAITKFDLLIPYESNDYAVDVQDINNWVIFRGFPNLFNLDLYKVTFDSHTAGGFLSRCPLVEILKLWDVDNMTMTTTFNILKLIRYFPRLQELSLDFSNCKLLADAEKRVPTTIPCLKSLNLHGIDFSSDIMVSCVIELICGSPNLETLRISAKHDYEVPPPALCSSDVDFSKMGQLRLQSVLLVCIGGLKNEECLIKSLLSGSPLLRKMEIHADLFQHVGVDNGKLMFATKLLELHRASPVAEIKLKF